SSPPISIPNYTNNDGAPHAEPLLPHQGNAARQAHGISPRLTGPSRRHDFGWNGSTVLGHWGSASCQGRTDSPAGVSDMTPNIPLILHAILEDYALPWGGDHGVAHWARVLENGLRLAWETGANIEVVSLFAILHDSRRLNECSDPDHGP